MRTLLILLALVLHAVAAGFKWVRMDFLWADTGERVWETFAATTGDKPVRWANAFLVKNGARTFLFNETGDLIIAKLSPAGYEEISRAHLLDPTNTDPGRPVVWSHPAFANRSVYARNDKEIVCVSLAK